MGTKGLVDYLKKYNILLDQKYDNKLGMNAKNPWKRYINRKNKHLCTPEALNLLDSLLVYDHMNRLTALQTMQHPFFAKQHQQQVDETRV